MRLTLTFALAGAAVAVGLGEKKGTRTVLLNSGLETFRVPFVLRFPIY